jgi:prepilin-type N-terminal cleavage/methylation domain-containing protein
MQRMRSTKAAGFTLIELVTVMLILGILVVLLVTQMGRTSDRAKERLTRVRLGEIGAVIDAYERRMGDFPPSEWRGEYGSPPNSLNIGIEALVVALFSGGRNGMGISADDLHNTDGDVSAKALTDLPTSDLFELVDSWDNPLAYVHHARYGEAQRYLTLDPDTGEAIENEFRALVNPRTRLPYQPGRYQLVSAGIDGRFGTEDDIVAFQR